MSPEAWPGHLCCPWWQSVQMSSPVAVWFAGDRMHPSARVTALAISVYVCARIVCPYIEVSLYCLYVVGPVTYMAPRVRLSPRSGVSALSSPYIRATVAREKPGHWCSSGVGAHWWMAWDAPVGAIILLISMCS